MQHMGERNNDKLRWNEKHMHKCVNFLVKAWGTWSTKMNQLRVEVHSGAFLGVSETDHDGDVVSWVFLISHSLILFLYYSYSIIFESTFQSFYRPSHLGSASPAPSGCFARPGRAWSAPSFEAHPWRRPNRRCHRARQPAPPGRLGPPTDWWFKYAWNQQKEELYKYIVKYFSFQIDPNWMTNKYK